MTEEILVYVCVRGGGGGGGGGGGIYYAIAFCCKLLITYFRKFIKYLFYMFRCVVVIDNIKVHQACIRMVPLSVEWRRRGGSLSGDICAWSKLVAQLNHVGIWCQVLYEMRNVVLGKAMLSLV